MPRVSRAQAARHRELTIEVSARLFRERGVDHVSVQDVMSAVGLTHGGFYRQFESKETLMAEALRHAYTSMAARMDETEVRADDHHAAQLAYIRGYLSAFHCDHPSQGCPTAGLVQDVARTGTTDARSALADDVTGFAQWLGGEAQDGLVPLSSHVLGARPDRADPGQMNGSTVLPAPRELAPLGQRYAPVPLTDFGAWILRESAPNTASAPTTRPGTSAPHP